MLDWITNFLSSDIMTATPLLITALGAVYSERAGILNIGNEGLMLTGAFFGATVSWITGSAFVGAVAAMAAAMVLNLILAFFVITVKANQVVAGAGHQYPGQRPDRHPQPPDLRRVHHGAQNRCV